MSINHTFQDGTDCHMHVYDRRYPFTPGATLLPPDALLTDYLPVRSSLGLSRSVVVQPSAYGTDNRCTMDACDALNASVPGSARAVIAIDASLAPSELTALRTRGVRGLRFGLAPGSANTPDGIALQARRAAEHGLHLQLTVSARRFVALGSQLAGLPCPLVVDHMGNIPPAEGAQHPAFAMLRRLLDTGNTWVKLSGAYLLTPAGSWDSAGELMRSLIAAAPERVVWGSNWPHPTHTAHPPDDLALMALLQRKSLEAGEAVAEQILRLNSQTLYGFDAHD